MTGPSTTDGRTPEEELRRSRQFVERVLRASPGTVYVLDLPRQTTVYLNHEADRDLGYTLEELQALPPQLHPDDLARVPEFNARWLTAADADVFENEVRLRHRSGEYRWRLVRETVFERDAAGAVTKVIGVGVDITDRKRHEERQAFLLKLADAIGPLADPLAVQREACRVLGEHLRVTRAFYAEVVGDDWVVAKGYESGVAPLPDGAYPAARFGPWSMRTYRDGGRLVFRDTQADPRLADAERRAHAAAGVGAAVGVPLVKGGRLVAILAVHSAAPRGWTADEVGLVEETAERTWAAVERAKAEAALRRSHDTFLGLVRDAPFGVYLADADFRLCQVSAGAGKVFAGVRPLLGRDLAEVLRVIWPEPFATEAIGRFRHTLATGEPYRSTATTERRHDIPAVESYDWHLARVPLPDGRFGVVCYFYDTTDLWRAAAADAFRAKLADALRPLADPVAVQGEACRVLGEHLRANRVAYFELRGPNYHVERDYAAAVPHLGGDYPVENFGPELLATFTRGQTAAAADVAADGGLTDAQRRGYAAIQIAAFIAVPLVKRGELIGGLAVHSAAPRGWTADEVGLVEETAERTWAAVERAKAEQALRDSRAFHELIAGLGSDWWFQARVEPNGEAVTELVSDGFTRRLGYTRDELMAAGGWAVLVHPDDLPEAERQMGRLMGGETIEGELRHVARDGTVTWSLYRTRPELDAAGRVVRVQGVARDITDRKRAEERLRLIVESATDYAILTLAPDRTVTSWNTGAVAVFGYTAEEVVGRSGDVLFTPEDRAARVPEREAETARREGRAQDERWHLRRDGSRFFASGVLSLLGDGGRGYLKVARDLTYRKRMEDELEQRVRERTGELAAAVDALGAEIARRRDLARRLDTAQEDERRRVARDLHDTLGQLQAGLGLGLAAVRRTPGLPPAADARLADVQRLADALSRETHALALRLRPTALDDLGLRPALAQLVADWSTRTGVPADLHTDGLEAGRLPAEVETAVYRVVQEALTNVQRHARAGRVGVSVTRLDGRVSVVVEDDGVGFDPHPPPPGRLGLVGMRERVELAGGTLEIESAARAGTSVLAHFTIPGGGERWAR